MDSEIFDLLCNMDATEEQLDFPILYASAKEVRTADGFARYQTVT